MTPQQTLMWGGNFDSHTVCRSHSRDIKIFQELNQIGRRSSFDCACFLFCEDEAWYKRRSEVLFTHPFLAMLIYCPESLNEPKEMLPNGRVKTNWQGKCAREKNMSVSNFSAMSVGTVCGIDINAIMCGRGERSDNHLWGPFCSGLKSAILVSYQLFLWKLVKATGVSSSLTASHLVKD